MWSRLKKLKKKFKGIKEHKIRPKKKKKMSKAIPKV